MRTCRDYLRSKPEDASESQRPAIALANR